MCLVPNGPPVPDVGEANLGKVWVCISALKWSTSSTHSLSLSLSLSLTHTHTHTHTQLLYSNKWGPELGIG